MLTHKAKISKVAPKWLRSESCRAGQGLRSPPALATAAGPGSWAHCPPLLHRRPWFPAGAGPAPSARGLPSVHNVLSVPLPGRSGLPTARPLGPLLTAHPSSWAGTLGEDPVGVGVPCEDPHPGSLPPPSSLFSPVHPRR